MTRGWIGLIASTALFGSMPASAAGRPTDAEEPRAVFAVAREICEADAGRLWGVSLCGPILLVDWRDRSVVADQADASGRLVSDGDVYRGILAEDVLIANSPTEWSGTRWTQLVLPVTDNAQHRRVLLGHELFHRVQPSLGLSMSDLGNRHLDTLEGRYLLLLEWRALSKALGAGSDRERHTAMMDAMAFRRERYRLFPEAATEEGSFEVAGGIPEYTGVMVGLNSPSDRIEFAIHDLSAFADAPTFVRSFAYATGPAIGLLLDREHPSWKEAVRKGDKPGQLLIDALGQGDGVQLLTRIRRYDDGTLRRSEELRETKRLASAAAYRARLVDGPVLALPLKNSNRQFNPQTLVPLDGFGVIYPSMRLVDDWGVLEVETGGALMNASRHRATVTLLASTARASVALAGI